jgi:hypothetical protein
MSHESILHVRCNYRDHEWGYGRGRKEAGKCREGSKQTAVHIDVSNTFRSHAIGCIQLIQATVNGLNVRIEEKVKRKKEA